MTDTSIDTILEKLEVAKKANDIDSCISLCRDGTLLCASPDTEGWYAFRINLAQFMVAKAKSGLTEYLESAIQVYSEIITSSRTPDANRNRGVAALGLGWAYYLRSVGDTGDNLRKAIDAFIAALDYYDRQTHTHAWASVKDALGLVYHMLAQTEYRNCMEHSIRNYEDARDAFVEAEHIDESSEMEEKLRGLREELAISELRQEGEVCGEESEGEQTGHSTLL